jgi:biopolymer transport protein ExbB/TolQ
MEHVVLSPLGLYAAAGLVGKTVMIALAVASLWCWVLIVEGIWSALRLSRATARARSGRADALVAPLETAGREAAHLVIPGEGVGERRHRIAEAMGREARALVARAEGGLANLAIVSSVAPFVGLFGTVWGIMTSFAGIAEAQDTSLAVVAPGIAEALAATAYGLAAAIPATIGYNRLGAAFGRIAGSLADHVEEVAVRQVAGGPSVVDESEEEVA